MLIITAGRVGPNKSVRFGGDASLDDGGRRSVAALADSGVVAGRHVVAGPEPATAQTCHLLATAFDTDPRLRTLDVGRWAGRLPEEIAPEELGAWFADPESCPHGGETISAFVTRIAEWRDTVADPAGVYVVAMPVAQALLASSAQEYFSVEVRPATAYER